jgi:GTP:adenosylcobinamide-phosphate guanylyltransferase
MFLVRIKNASRDSAITLGGDTSLRSMEPTGSITAVILAGQRPGIDRLAAAEGQRYKALVRVAGRPMVAYPLQAMLDHPRIGTVLLLGQDCQAILYGLDDSTLAQNPSIIPVDGPNSISQAVAAAVQRTAGPILVTTADHVLLSHKMIDAMLDENEGGDVAIAMVERRLLLAHYPQSKRTWLKFRGGWWSGANLFWLAGGDRLMPLLEFWQEIEGNRKKGWRIILAFGPVLALGAMLRLWTIHEAVKRAGQRFGLTVSVIAMREAEACIDVDKPDDKILVESILSARS